MNWDRLSELREEVGEDALAEVLGMFLEETDALAAQLQTGADPATLCQDMHFMKGAALNIGFDGLAALCQTAETAAAKGAGESVDLPAILDCYAESRAELMNESSALGLVA